ncbi:MAG: SDR family oxidoreductase [Candidatus Omnitrophota bacterium]
MKILVTGGAGFIGSHIVEHFQGKADVVVLDSLRSGFEKNIKDFKVNFIKGSITDFPVVLEATKGVDYIFHLGAMISVPESLIKPVECVEINVNGTLNVLKAAAENGVKKIVLSSSAAIYGDNPVVPKVETMLPEPKSPYAVTKLDGEYYFKLFKKEWGINTVSLRYFNVFGPRQDPKSQYAAAIPIFVHSAIANKDITVFGDGEQTRDFIYVKDVARANVLVTEKGEGVYNVACGGKITISDLARKIIKITNSKSKIIYADERPGDVKHSMADISRIQSIGFKPEFDQDEGLQKTIDYFINLYSGK